MISFWHFLNKVTGLHEAEFAGKVCNFRNWFYARLKKCPNCKVPMEQDSISNKGTKYRRAWVMCRCGCVFCVGCMVFPKGKHVRCPKCWEKETDK